MDIIQDNNDKDNKPKKNIDLTTVHNTVNSLIVCKVLEGQDMFMNLLGISNPVAKLFITYAIFNIKPCFNMFGHVLGATFSRLKMFDLYSKSLLYTRHLPVKKTYEINSLQDGENNSLYLAFSWYLKTVAEKPVENHIVLQIQKSIQPSKEEYPFEIQKSVPRNTETTFTYDGYKFNYSVTEHEDVVYGVSNEMKRKNYKLLIWTYENADHMIEGMSNDIANMYAKSKLDSVWKLKIFNHKKGIWNESSVDRQGRTISSVILQNNIEREIFDELQYFVEKEKWFNEKMIPYKKSYLFYGPPGTGKTSMIKAISSELKRHIYYLNLANIENDDELTKLMGKMIFTDVTLIIEDIDAQTTAVQERNKEVYSEHSDHEDMEMIGRENKKREPENKKSGVTLSALLNQVDGVQNNYGMILIITTNKPKSLDSALLREGRVDRKVFFDFATNEQIYQMFSRFYEEENTITVERINTWRETNDIKIAPAAVENAMVRHYGDCEKAFIKLQEYKGFGGDIEKFTY